MHGSLNVMSALCSICCIYDIGIALILAIGLDFLRLALLNECGCKHFVGDEDSGKVFLGELLAFAV